MRVTLSGLPMENYSVRPSLSHAYVRVRWAHKQLKELESLCANRSRILKAKVRYPKIVNKLPKHTGDLFAVPGSRMPFLSQILTGQIINGLRSALDYLVANLAQLDSGRAKRRTQFPIEDSAKDFSGRTTSFLAGLNRAHIAAIEKLQPYNGCVWTKRLRVLSNLDKHNSLIPAKMDFVFSGDFDPVTGTQANSTKYKVRMHVTPTVYVSLGEELPLIEAIREIYAGVAQTLADFDPAFK